MSSPSRPTSRAASPDHRRRRGPERPAASSRRVDVPAGQDGREIAHRQSGARRSENQCDGGHHDHLGLRAHASPRYEHALAHQPADELRHRLASRLDQQLVAQVLAQRAGDVDGGHRSQDLRPHRPAGSPIDVGADPVHDGSRCCDRRREIGPAVAAQDLPAEVHQGRPARRQLGHPEPGLGIGDAVLVRQHLGTAYGVRARSPASRSDTRPGPGRCSAGQRALARRWRHATSGRSSSKLTRRVCWSGPTRWKSSSPIHETPSGNRTRHQVDGRHHHAAQRPLRLEQGRLAVTRAGGDQQARDAARAPAGRGCGIRTRRSRQPGACGGVTDTSGPAPTERPRAITATGPDGGVF